MASRYPTTPTTERRFYQPGNEVMGSRPELHYEDASEPLKGRDSPLSVYSQKYGGHEVATQTERIQWHSVQLGYLERHLGRILQNTLTDNPPEVVVSNVTPQAEDTLLDQRQLLINSISRLRDFIVTNNNCCATTIIVLLIVVLAVVAIILVKQFRWV